MMGKDDPIDRGRMQQPFDQWEQGAKERLEQSRAQAAAAAAAPVREKGQAAFQRPVTSPESAPTETAAYDKNTAALSESSTAGHTAALGASSDTGRATASGEPSTTGSAAALDGSADAQSPADDARGVADDGDNTVDDADDGEEEPAESGRSVLILLRLLGEALLLAVLLFWAWSVASGGPLPPFLRAESHSLFSVGTGAVLFLLADLLGAGVLARGFVSLFTLGRSTSAPVALAFLGGIAAFVPVVTGSAFAETDIFYIASVCACLVFELLADWLDSRRALRDAAAGVQGVPARLARLGAGEDEQRVVCPGDTPAAALPRDGAPRTGGRTVTVLSAVLLVIAAAALAVDLLVFRKSIGEAALLFAAVACSGAPLAAGLCAALPLFSTQKALRRHGAGLSGYGAVRAFGRADTLLLPERLLYPAGQVRLCALRPLGGDDMEEAVLAAASVAHAARLAVEPAILGMLVGAQSLLRPVEQLRVKPEMGVEAQVDGRRVLLGSRALLRQNQVDLTGRMLLEVEAKYAVKGNDFFYLAVGETPCAMFVLEYKPQRALRAALRGLTGAGVSLLVSAADPNITRDSIAEQFRLHKRMLGLLSRARTEELKPEADAPDGTSLCVREDGEAQVRAATACVRLYETGQVTSAVQVLGALAGAGMTLALYLLRGWLLGPLEVLGLQAVWALPAFLVAAFRRHI